MVEDEELAPTVLEELHLVIHLIVTKKVEKEKMRSVVDANANVCA